MKTSEDNRGTVQQSESESVFDTCQNKILDQNQAAQMLGARILGMVDWPRVDDEENLDYGYSLLNVLGDQHRLMPMDATESKYWLPDVEKILAELEIFPAIDSPDSESPHWIIQAFDCPSGLRQDILKALCS
jgi:hypothetical protein